MARVQSYERYSKSDIESTVVHILGAESPVRVKRRRAMEYSRDVLKAMVRGECHAKSAVPQLLKLWRKTGILR
jgi:hypothetical protein